MLRARKRAAAKENTKKQPAVAKGGCTENINGLLYDYPSVEPLNLLGQTTVLDSRFFLPFCFLFNVRTTAAIAVIGTNAAAPRMNDESGLFCKISIVTVIDTVRDGTDESFTTTRSSNVPVSSGTFQVNEPSLGRLVAIGIHRSISSLLYSNVTLSGLVPSLDFHFIECSV